MKMRRYAMALAGLAGAGSLIAGTSAQAAILYDQITPKNGLTVDSTTGTLSQIFGDEISDAGFELQSSAAIDDFQIRYDSAIINKVDVVLQYHQALLSARNGSSRASQISYYQVNFYSNVSETTPLLAEDSFVGNVASYLVAGTNVSVSTFVADNGMGSESEYCDLVSLTIPDIELPRGAYWMSVVPRMNASGGPEEDPNGTLFVSASNIGDGLYSSTNSILYNPDGGWNTVGGFDNPQGNNIYQLRQNLAYRLSGVTVPEPTSLAAILPVGLLAGRRRR